MPCITMNRVAWGGAVKDYICFSLFYLYVGLPIDRFSPHFFFCTFVVCRIMRDIKVLFHLTALRNNYAEVGFLIRHCRRVVRFAD